ncbi:NAD-binding protein [Favolaschia claudopus]|uniref:NAD-binding protein n=1 Tax=Favolaschia claudopus TaxID=2862362 RepID=A0AAW0DM64_9AGAR
MPGNKGVALVTGAAQGIGEAIALRLAEDGFDVAVNDMASSAEKLQGVVDEIIGKGRSSSKHIADVSKEEEVAKMVEDVVQHHGGLDVMVANAGVTGKPAVPFTEIPCEEFERVMSINARGTFLCYKHAGIQMIKQGRGGRIIGASSIAGKKGMLTQGPYCASKFAVRGLTQAAGKKNPLEFGTHRITVNAYAPGVIDTPILRDAAVNGDPSEIIKTMKEMAPLKRIGIPEDISNLVSFLASEESHFITGMPISINGGIWFD